MAAYVGELPVDLGGAFCVLKGRLGSTRRRTSL